MKDVEQKLRVARLRGSGEDKENQREAGSHCLFNRRLVAVASAGRPFDSWTVRPLTLPD